MGSALDQLSAGPASPSSYAEMLGSLAPSSCDIGIAIGIWLRMGGEGNGNVTTDFKDCDVDYLGRGLKNDFKGFEGKNRRRLRHWGHRIRRRLCPVLEREADA
jgi:hypothetical protein